jgi:hypothetical protein
MVMQRLMQLRKKVRANDFPLAFDKCNNHRGYKWIKWIEKIELTDNPNYRGYWEQRGYSNSGDLNGSYFMF